MRNMRNTIRNVVTLVVGVAGGIYAGENMPDIYYSQIIQYLPKVDFLEAYKDKQGNRV